MEKLAPTSTAVWKMAGVVSDEKVMVLAVNSSAGKLPKNWLMMDVLAVPGPPTSRDAWPDARGEGSHSEVQAHHEQQPYGMIHWPFIQCQPTASTARAVQRHAYLEEVLVP